MESVVARQTWRTLEPLHGLVYFGAVQTEAYRELGLHGASGYFASRSAPLGVVPTEVVVATFFNFYPPLIREALDGVWTVTSPEAVIDTRLSLIDRLLREQIPDVLDSDEMEEAAELAREAAHAALNSVVGRPLFAAHAALAWPDPPHLVLWHAQTLLREFRGDGHIATLTATGVTGCEALIMHAATGELPATILQSTRAWPDEQWTEAINALIERDLLKGDGSFTSEGLAQRQWVEARTDELALPAYLTLGEEGCRRLRALVRPWSKAITEGGSLGAMSQHRDEPTQ